MSQTKVQLVNDVQGDVGFGTASPDQILHLNKSSGDTYLRLQGGTNQGTLIHATDGTLLGGFVSGGAVGGTATDMAVRVESGHDIVFAHGTTERMRMDLNGSFRVGITTSIFNSSVHERFSVKNNSQGNAGTLQSTNVTGGFPVLYVSSTDTTASQNAIIFQRTGGGVGTITTSASSTAYNTSSDYRLKENAVAISDGITRLKTLKPYRFNWKIDPDTTVDGFFAHEVTAVPESVTGTKDEVSTDDNGAIPKGDPIYQTIDHSKLVPLLTAALQEEIAKREALEARVATLEAA